MPENSNPYSSGQARPTFLVRNQMPQRLEIRGAATNKTLKLAPLQTVRVYDRPSDFLGAAAMHAHTDRAVAWEREPVRSTRIWVTAWLSLFAALFVGAGLALVLLDARRWAWAAVVSAVLAGLCVAGAAWLNRPRDDGCDDPMTGEVGQMLTGGRFVRDVSVSALQKLALVIVLVVGILGPTAAIYYGSELSAIVRVTGWRIDPPVDQSDYPVIVARAIQIVLVVILALIPGLMYFQFDREKLTTLIDRWMHHAFRMDPTLKTISDIDAKYGRRVEEFYGAAFDPGVTTAKRRSSTRSPLYVATILLGVGWIVVLLNDPVDTASIQRFIQPRFTPMTCAFLGAYFFAVQVVLLGYVRGDLRPKTYNVVTVRILVAVILAWMLQALWGSANWVLAASFIGGIVPETVLRYIRDAGTQIQHQAKRWWSARGATATDASGQAQDHGANAPAIARPPRIDEFEDRSPLIALDGIGIYERTRLAEEGITSIQALATHDLVDLMLSSRIPASRLIDWLDQALLYQHVTPEDMTRLRRAGVRTATELLSAGRSADLRELLTDMLKNGRSRLPVILQALCNDEWLAYVTNWREHDDTKEPGRVIYTDHGLLKQRGPASGNGLLQQVSGPMPPQQAEALAASPLAPKDRSVPTRSAARTAPTQ
jgi:hypothetical protein